MIAAVVANKIGFDVIYGSGYWTVASAYGLPDADTGFGGLLNVHHTVRACEQAGITAIQIEDQEFPKKCGHTPGKRVIPAADILFPEALTSDEEARIVTASVDRPMMANMADGGLTPIRDAKTLQGLGYALSIFPAMTSLAAAAAMEAALLNLKQTGTSLSPDVPLFNFKEFCSLIGFEDVWAFEKKWAK